MKLRPITMDNIDLVTERLQLKRLSDEHISDTYVSWLNDSEVNMFLETRGGYTIDRLRSYVAEQNSNAVYFWAIHLKGSDRHIGNIKIDPIDMRLKSGEYGILMGDRQHWGYGFAKEASLRILKYCFGELKLSTITLGVIENNQRAVKLYEKIGFTVDEINPNAGIYNNKPSNSLRMSIHAESFK